MSEPKIEFVPVANSSNIEAVRYDEANNQMFVNFKGGARYRYDAVPVQDGRIIEATAKLDKISTGQLINRFLKTPKLKYEKLTP